MKKKYKYWTSQYAHEITDWLSEHPEANPISVTFRGTLADGMFYLFYYEMV